MTAFVICVGSSLLSKTEDVTYITKLLYTDYILISVFVIMLCKK